MQASCANSELKQTSADLDNDKDMTILSEYALLIYA